MLMTMIILIWDMSMTMIILIWGMLVTMIPRIWDMLMTLTPHIWDMQMTSDGLWLIWWKQRIWMSWKRPLVISAWIALLCVSGEATNSQLHQGGLNICNKLLKYLKENTDTLLDYKPATAVSIRIGCSYCIYSDYQYLVILVQPLRP